MATTRCLEGTRKLVSVPVAARLVMQLGLPEMPPLEQRAKTIRLKTLRVQHTEAISFYHFWGDRVVEGPVEVELEDGTGVTSDRFRVALCTCRRSRRYPWCDTSHRDRA